jgi:hypothetical protein
MPAAAGNGGQQSADGGQNVDEGAMQVPTGGQHKGSVGEQ